LPRKADAIYVSMTDHRIERRRHEVNAPYAGQLVDFYTRADALSLEGANTRDPSVEALQRFIGRVRTMSACGLHSAMLSSVRDAPQR
jgi:hypothetical protein